MTYLLFFSIITVYVINAGHKRLTSQEPIKIDAIVSK